MLNSKLVWTRHLLRQNIDDPGTGRERSLLPLDFFANGLMLGSLGNQGVEIGLTANPTTAVLSGWLKRTDLNR